MTRVVFMGTPDFAVPVLRKLMEEHYEIVGVVTQPDRPKGRKKTLTPPPVKAEALKWNLNVLQPERIRNKEEVESVLSLKPDIIITAAYGQILPKELLVAPKYRCINVHASLLPELRGGAPIHYAILQGKKETGITIMYMAERLDAGDILKQASIPIEETDHVGTLHDKLSKVGANLLVEMLPQLLDGTINPIKQEEEKVTFAPNITREQEQIDWTLPGERIYDHIRGLHPWPVAFTTLMGKTWKVWWGEKYQITGAHHPGSIIEIKSDGIIVATGNKLAIKITELQPFGKKRMKASQFINGAGKNLEVGMVLGD